MKKIIFAFLLLFAQNIMAQNITDADVVGTTNSISVILYSNVTQNTPTQY